MVGITPMIGRNDESDETFSTSNASKVLAFAQANKIGELAFWAVSRDNGSCPGQTGGSTDNCSGISQSNYAFTNIFKPFTSSGGSTSGGAPIGTTIWLRATNNNNYVSARIDQTNSPLDASATQVQAWEEFTWLPQSDGTVALQATANGDYVSARTSQTNIPLDASVTQIQGWEKFTWGQV